MSDAWRKYQDSAAVFFSNLGFETNVDLKVVGARGTHKIDVFVSGFVHGIPFRWVVECKHWKSNIPKEKVMTLISIVQDIGADRGFLLSETGFQSGAIRAARNTNIFLSSLEDLILETQATLIRDETTYLLGRRELINKRLWKLHKKTGAFISHFMGPMSEISFVDLALDDGLRKEFPIVYTVTRDGDKPVANDWDDLIKKVTTLLDSAELYAAKHEKEFDK